MNRNTVLAVILSAAFLFFWWAYVKPPVQNTAVPAGAPTISDAGSTSCAVTTPAPVTPQAQKEIAEKEIVVENDQYKAVFTNRGAAVKHWFLKDHGVQTDLVLCGEQLSTYPGTMFGWRLLGDNGVEFTTTLREGWRITKTYDLSNKFLHELTLKADRTKKDAVKVPFEIFWTGGLGTVDSEKNDNLAQTRAIGLTDAKPQALQKFKPGEYSAAEYSWSAVDNRYFLAAFLPEKLKTLTAFTKINVSVEKKMPPEVAMSGWFDPAGESHTVTTKFYLGPKGYQHLKSLNLKLEEAVDFGWFGFLGKGALWILTTLFSITHNYGWAIILLTLLLQLLVFPLTLKSLKAAAAMKKIQPLMKELQTKYKADPQRMNVELMNLYKTQGVNPLSGCLPMILQLPIFWALFTTLRNAYEIHGAPWIFWIHDLSMKDPYYVLPVLMGLGMLLQQKMTATATDPAQAKMMMFMPVIFTFMFLKFPAGLVLYWLVNNILTVSEQYVIMRMEERRTALAKI